MPRSSDPTPPREILALPDALRRLAAGDVSAWHGLPQMSTIDVIQRFGEPLAREESQLGLVPATRLEFAPFAPVESLVAWVRDHAVVMMELRPVPRLDALMVLGMPDRVLPSELRVEEAIAPEYLYATRGLLITVRDPFDPAEPREILRLRLLRPQDPKAPLEPGLHASRANRIDFGGSSHG